MNTAIPAAAAAISASNAAVAANQAQPDTCPECNGLESIKKVCRHCGYEYKTESLTFLEGLFVFFIIIFIVGVIIWVPMTLWWWFDPPYNMDDPTLLKVLESQWDWLGSKHIW